MLQRSEKLARAILYFVEQADVLDGDHGLVGKRGSELDLLGIEWIDHRARQGQHADEGPLTKQRNTEQGAGWPHVRRPDESEFQIGLGIGHVDDDVFQCSAPDQRSSPGLERNLCQKFLVIFRKSVACLEIKDPIPGTEYARPFGAAKTCRGFGERVQYYPQIEGRAADDLEHLGGGRLLLQGFA